MGTFNAIVTDTAQKYLDTFGETIQHRPCGNQSEEVDIEAHFDEDELAGRNPEDIEDDRGTRIRQLATIIVLPSSAIDHRSHVVKDSQVWKVIQKTGGDVGLEDWLCERTEKIRTKPAGSMK